MALGAQVVDLIGPNVPQHLVEGTGVVQVAVVKKHADSRLMGILVDVVYPAGIEGGRATDDAVHLVALLQEKFRQVGAVLAGDTGDECFFHREIPFRVAGIVAVVNGHSPRR